MFDNKTTVFRYERFERKFRRIGNDFPVDPCYMCWSIENIPGSQLHAFVEIKDRADSTNDVLTHPRNAAFNGTRKSKTIISYWGLKPAIVEPDCILAGL